MSQLRRAAFVTGPRTGTLGHDRSVARGGFRADYQTVRASVACLASAELMSAASETSQRAPWLGLVF